MKKIIISVFLLCLALPEFAQVIGTPEKLNTQDYFRKSNQQRTVAKIILGVGSLAATTGLLVGLDDVGGIFDPTDKDNASLSEGLIYGGLAVAALSIPVWISARKNQRKGINMTLQAQAFGHKNKGAVHSRTTPSLNFKIEL